MLPDRLAGKHVLVIGGSKGIGRGVAEACLAAGARVTLTGSTQHSADAAVAAILTAASSSSSSFPSQQHPGSSSEPVSVMLTGLGCDLLAPADEAVEQALDDVLERAGSMAPIDHVVLTAADGLAVCGVEELSAERVRGVARMRMLVPVLLGKVALRHFLKALEKEKEGEEQGKGKGEKERRDKSLTLTTGGIAHRPQPGWSLMSYVMAGTNALARNLALDAAARSAGRVRVNAVEPGAVDTPLWGDGDDERLGRLARFADALPTRRVAAPADVAEAYVYLMRDWNATGEVVMTRGGAHLV
ncbi:short chain dehydrogenase [Biscogniauxia mediterranea]|nr:short chain dehydrogenase [Biscogniauxia mediterranea]